MPGTEERWTVLDGAPDATIVTDPRGIIVYANPRTEQTLGWRRTDLVGRHVEVLVPTELRTAHALHHGRYHGSPQSRMMGSGLELRAACRDGTTIPVEIALSPIRDGTQTLVAASIRDISDRIRLSQALNQTMTRLAVVDERDRIARDLHDSVIQRLFASGLHLQAALGRPDQAERVATVIDEIDDAIKDIRTTIFTMHSPRGLLAGFEPALDSVVAEASRVLGYRPHLVINGLAALIPDDITADAIAVTRELLTNVAKHARSSSSTITVEVGDGRLSVVVADDGVGFDPRVDVAGDGLHNIEHRATAYGGTVSVAPAEAGGTTATWTVPLR